MNWRDQAVLITGGTGSFGKAFTRFLLDSLQPKKIIIFSRDELKQHEMRVGGFDDPSLRYFIGDVRDRDRLQLAMRNVTIVVHAAALKQVPACEYNPAEAIKTNIDGAQNVIDAALAAKVSRVMALSTDKAVNPVNLYGATKLVAEKLFIQANVYGGGEPPRFSCCRYGNVVGSRGSVIPLFQRQRELGTVTVTDPRMTRFWITLDQGVRLVARALETMQGGEVFIPKLPTMNIMDLAAAVAPDCAVKTVGIRPGEKLHEVLMSEEEVRRAVEYDGMYIVQPAHAWWNVESPPGSSPLPEGFRYSSASSDWKLTPEELRAMIAGTP